MVKVAAPMFSLDASGSLAGAIVFSKWKGRNYVRQLVRPSNPKSALQVAVRVMFKFLSQAWKNVGGTPQASWEELAAAGIVSPFNSFMARNQSRWREFSAPSQTYPAPETGTLPVATLDSATAGSRHADLAFSITTLNNVWGVAIFQSPTGTFTPAIGNCIAILPVDNTGAMTYTVSGLPPGAVFFDAKFFTKEGVLGTDEGEVTCTVTV